MRFNCKFLVVIITLWPLPSFILCHIKYSQSEQESHCIFNGIKLNFDIFQHVYVAVIV